MKRHSESFLLGTGTPVEDLGGGIKRQILGFNDDLMMVRVEFETDAVGAIHSHQHSQASYVESGEFDVHIDGVVTRLGPGDSFYIHPNLEHGAVCRKAGVLLDVFSPAREDFLRKEK